MMPRNVAATATAMGLCALFLATPRAQALVCADAASALFPDGGSAAEAMRRGGLGCTAARWPGGPLWVVAAAQGNTLTVALLEETEGGPQVAATTPPDTDALTIDPIWSAILEIVPSPLGSSPGVVAVSLANAYTSTGRSTNTRALHLFLRRDATLAPIFVAFTSASHSYAAPCRVRRANDDPCRRAWTLRQRIEATPARPGAMPDLLVRDLRTGRVVSRHRWTGNAYRPPVFDRTPSLGEG